MEHNPSSSGSAENQSKNIQSTDGYTLGGASVASYSIIEPDIQYGTIIDDFIIQTKIGPGGFGVVYKAQQRSIPREVALKIIRPDKAFQGIIERVQKEK